MKHSRLALLLLLPASDLLADTASRDQALKLPDTLISANRQVEARNDSSAANTVFTREDIDRLQPTSLTDLLQRVPGVQIAQTGGRSSLPGVYIRGTNSSQSLVLVDGQRIGSSSSGDSNLQFINIEQIERVEVLRGSRSAIYGSDAIGGVIQIFTRRGAQQGLQGRMHLGFGSNQTWQRSLGLSGGDQQTRFSLGASLDETAGINSTRTSFPSDNDHDAYRNQSLSLSLSHAFDDNLEAGLNLLDNRGRSQYDSPFGYFDMATNNTYQQQPYTDFTVSSISSFIDARLNDSWKSRLELGHAENRDAKRDKLTVERSTFNTYRDTLNWQNDLSLDERNSLILGGDWYEDRLNTSAAYGEDSRWNRAAFIQHRFHGDNFSTELGLRHDRNQQFGSQNTWSGSLTVPVNPDNDLLLSYSEGFRAPTFTDLYYPNSSNPQLKPEHSKSYELQWRSQLTPDSRLETSLYRIDLKDAIIYNTSARRPENIGSARINGLETALKQEWFGWQTSAGVAIIDPRNRQSGEQLPRRAKRTLNLDLDRQFERLAFGASWQLVSSSRENRFGQKQAQLGGYGLLGLRSSWAVNQELKLDLKLDNVFDKSYSRALYSHQGSDYGYREEGRTWMLGVTWTPEL
ncbi:TonB-dependent receptor domain-containing protein [Pseudomonas sessilinigenes]|uniref:TonB-dependent receptor n=1 Tax=Pseudomonas sessilinigenes TaxID=658629 RepID=A0ABX8MNU1_9PSED|nr:TonB-dependent receptor [Pseudomonas sessilinigenes]AZC25815.1 Outer membrane vitamin B12 receptor BtuB [Pseudomonas sessilinigenes]QXH40140.1 TonB-dependent receptor [Pseudomonas sessilinigenes]